MVNPVSSGFSQTPLSTTFQPGGGNTQTGTAEQRPEENRPQPAQAPAANSQQTNEQGSAGSQDNDTTALKVASEERRNDTAPPAPDAPRGSLIDIQA